MLFITLSELKALVWTREHQEADYSSLQTSSSSLTSNSCWRSSSLTIRLMYSISCSKIKHGVYFHYISLCIQRDMGNLLWVITLLSTTTINPTFPNYILVALDFLVIFRSCFFPLCTCQRGKNILDIFCCLHCGNNFIWVKGGEAIIAMFYSLVYSW